MKSRANATAPLPQRERVEPVLSPGLGQAQGLSKDEGEFTIPLNPPFLKGDLGGLCLWVIRLPRPARNDDEDLHSRTRGSLDGPRKSPLGACCKRVGFA